MKKLYCIIVCVVLAGNVFAYDFSSIAPSGQTLYYSFHIGGTGEVSVSYPGEINPKPTGNLVIPSTVFYGGTTYSVTRIGFQAFDNCSGLTTPNTYW